MLATRAGIFMPAWMAIKARHLQYASTREFKGRFTRYDRPTT